MPCALHVSLHGNRTGNRSPRREATMKTATHCGLVLLFACSTTVAAEETVFVEGGTARSVQEVGKKWAADDGGLACSGTGNFLVAGKALGSGDFRVRARLALQETRGHRGFPFHRPEQLWLRRPQRKTVRRGRPTGQDPIGRRFCRLHRAGQTVRRRGHAPRRRSYVPHRRQGSAQG